MKQKFNEGDNMCFDLHEQINAFASQYFFYSLPIQ